LSPTTPPPPFSLVSWCSVVCSSHTASPHVVWLYSGGTESFESVDELQVFASAQTSVPGIYGSFDWDSALVQGTINEVGLQMSLGGFAVDPSDGSTTFGAQIEVYDHTNSTWTRLGDPNTAGLSTPSILTESVESNASDYLDTQGSRIDVRAVPRGAGGELAVDLFELHVRYTLE
ncbi:MAG: hypothetical protein AAFQ82_23620, partial [Myxococcota bacterium]